MNRVLIIGGTGTVGRQVVSQLMDLGAQVRVMTRNLKKACLPGGALAVYGDLTRPESLDACLNGIDAVFLFSPRP